MSHQFEANGNRPADHPYNRCKKCGLHPTQTEDYPECLADQTTKIPKDKCGTPITTGAFISYGHALGRCAGLRIGKVLNIKWERKGYSGDSNWKITVWGVDDDWSAQKVKLCQTRGTLQFPERIIVLPPSMVPEKFKKLLEPVTLETKKNNRVAGDDVS